jgi:hypothetical protein
MKHVRNGVRRVQVEYKNDVHGEAIFKNLLGKQNLIDANNSKINFLVLEAGVKPTCHRCKQVGHFVASCPVQRAPLQTTSNPVSYATVANPKHNEHQVDQDLLASLGEETIPKTPGHWNVEDETNDSPTKIAQTVSQRINIPEKSLYSDLILATSNSNSKRKIYSQTSSPISEITSKKAATEKNEECENEEDTSLSVSENSADLMVEGGNSPHDSSRGRERCDNSDGVGGAR